MVRFIGEICLLICGCLIMGCKEINPKTANPFSKRKPQIQRSAQAQLIPINEKNFAGQVSFYSEAEGVKVVGRVKNLAPGNYGLFVHELGNCQNKGKATGPLLGSNPIQDLKGAPSGNLGVLKVDSDSNANLAELKPALSLSGNKSLLGRSVVLRKILSENEGDLAKTNTATIIGCGIIGLVADAPDRSDNS